MKRYCILTKKSLLAAAAVALSLIFVLVVFSLRDGLVAALAGARKLPIYCTEQSEKKIAFTFDAAWGADDTDELLAIFKKENIHVTFFLVGEWVDRYPDKVRAIAAAGHELANHSDSHPHLTNLSREKIAEQLQGCNEKIKALTGATPTLLRPPYGDYNNAVIETAESVGLQTIQWSVDSLDWKDLSAEEITARVTAGVQPGGIVLFHNAAKHTPEALPGLIQSLKAQGYAFVPVGELLHPAPFTIDHTGKQIPETK